MRSVASKTCYGDGGFRYMKDDKIVSEYGASPDVLVTLWKLLSPHLIESQSEPHHMLWWLYYCKHYPTKEELEKILGVSAPTSRKHMEPIKKGFFKIRNKVVSLYCTMAQKNRLEFCSLNFPLFARPQILYVLRFGSKIAFGLTKEERARSTTTE